MTTDNTPLSLMKPGQTGVILSVQTPEEVRYKLMEMGIGPGERVEFIRTAPLGDPIEIELMNYRLALRKGEAAKIVIMRDP